MIDGKALDEILHERYPDHNLLGLVPTLLHWLEDPAERKVVWKRFESEEKQVVPILMCPDDVDFSCIILNVEIEKTETTVKWHRFGIDQSDSALLPESIGTILEWLDGVPSWEFDRASYDQFASTFKSEIEKDEIKKILITWIDRVKQSEQIPPSIKSFHFEIIETEKDYQVGLFGCSNYNSQTVDWYDHVQYVPVEQYVSLENASKKWNHEEITSIVKVGIEEFIETRISPLSFVHEAEYMTTGFDQEKLLKIEQRLHAESAKLLAKK